MRNRCTGPLVRQFRYLASLDEVSAATAGPAAAVVERQADLIDSEELSLSTPPSELPFGAPASYWLDVRTYDPVTAAGALNCPVLIVQGGRDYQVTVDDDLARWKAGLVGRPGMTVRVYPPTTTCSLRARDLRGRPSTTYPFTSTPRSSPTSLSG